MFLVQKIQSNFTSEEQTINNNILTRYADDFAKKVLARVGWLSSEDEKYITLRFTWRIEQILADDKKAVFNSKLLAWLLDCEIHSYEEGPLYVKNYIR